MEEFADAQGGRLLVREITEDRAAAEQSLQDDEVQVLIVVPDLQVEDLTDSERSILLVQHSFLDPLEGQAIQLLTDSAVADINDRIVQTVIRQAQQVATDASDRLEEARLDGDVVLSAEQETRLIEAQDLAGQDPRVLATPLLGQAEAAGGVVSTSQFYAPAVAALIVQHLTITFVALSLSRERSQRTVELLAISPLRPAERLMGKAVAYILIGLLIGAALLAAVVALLGAPIRGGVGPVALIVLLELVASIGIGFVLAALSRTTTQVVQGSMLILLLSVFFGGLLLSPERLLEWSRPVGYILPMSHAIEGLRASMLRGVAIDSTPLLALGGIAVATFAVGGFWATRRPGA